MGLKMFRLGEIVKIKDSIANEYEIHQLYGIITRIYLTDIFEIRMMEPHIIPRGNYGDTESISHYTMGLEGEMLEHV